ncbi:MAG: isochorismatase family protein [Phycisphaerales bacterium]|nr:isochorismatase family protein [Phycisphaerales bacterium]
MSTFDISIAATQLLVVDVQERLLPHIDEHERVVTQTVRMLRAARLMGLTRTLCEQYPQGLGGTDRRIGDAADGSPVLHKMTFSAARDPALLEHLRSHRRETVLIAGIETHVCVQQTACDLHDAGLRPVLLADAVGSRRAGDHAVALEGMRAMGLTVTTVEAALYRLAERAGTELFRAMLPIIK